VHANKTPKKAREGPTASTRFRTDRASFKRLRAAVAFESFDNVAPVL
jgi:hypothetical protein